MDLTPAGWPGDGGSVNCSRTSPRSLEIPAIATETWHHWLLQHPPGPDPWAAAPRGWGPSWKAILGTPGGAPLQEPLAGLRAHCPVPDLGEVGQLCPRGTLRGALGWGAPCRPPSQVRAGLARREQGCGGGGPGLPSGQRASALEPGRFPPTLSLGSLPPPTHNDLPSQLLLMPPVRAPPPGHCPLHPPQRGQAKGQRAALGRAGQGRGNAPGLDSLPGLPAATSNHLRPRLRSAAADLSPSALSLGLPDVHLWGWAAGLPVGGGALGPCPGWAGACMLTPDDPQSPSLT